MLPSPDRPRLSPAQTVEYGYIPKLEPKDLDPTTRWRGRRPSASAYCSVYKLCLHCIPWYQLRHILYYVKYLL